MPLSPHDFLIPGEALGRPNRSIETSAHAHGAEGESPSHVAVTFEFHPLGRVVSLRCSGAVKAEIILED